MKTSQNACRSHSIIDNKIVITPYRNVDNLAPAASICSSANDLSKWLLCQLGNGKIYGTQKIDSVAIIRTRKPKTILGRVKFPDKKMHYRLYGLGWGLRDYYGHEIISHTGGVNGFLSVVTLIPEENLGIVVLTNSDANTLYYALSWQIVDSFLGV